MGLLVSVLAVSLLAVGIAGPALAADSSIECAAGSGGGPVYVTDSGLEVADNTTAADEAYPAFPNDETVALEDANVSFAAAGLAELRLEARSVGLTCVAGVNASANDVLIDPAEGPELTINGSLEALSFGPLDFESDDADLTYDANDSVTLTLGDTGLDEGETVDVESLDSDAVDAEVDAGSNGTLSVELPAGIHRLSLSTASSGGGLPGLPPPPPDDGEPAAFEYAEAAVEPTEIDVGEEITASTTVTNVGDETGSHVVKLLVDGDVVAEESVSLAGGSSETVTLTTVLDAAGTVAISLGDESAGSVTVTDEEPGSDDDSGSPDPGSDDAGSDAGTDDGEPTPDPESDGDEDSGTPWLLITFGLLALVTAGVGVAYSQGYLDPYLPG
ncbi:CARDB domain-containing protein [Halovivax gelatinilyticus]|uniref:CARDB domain-containing protein n=1 Tax=Halovivax gelatinilyticus TaxID=2961597 RepID=UPI0020CA829C|nr:CARDB domain-containing protein [Halovivax gelatinilyticus]